MSAALRLPSRQAKCSGVQGPPCRLTQHGPRTAATCARRCMCIRMRRRHALGVCGRPFRRSSAAHHHCASAYGGYPAYRPVPLTTPNAPRRTRWGPPPARFPVTWGGGAAATPPAEAHAPRGRTPGTPGARQPVAQRVTAPHHLPPQLPPQLPPIAAHPLPFRLTNTNTTWTQ